MTLTNATPFIAGNWKMHKTVAEAEELVSQLMAASADMMEAEVVVIPPFTALNKVKNTLCESPIQLGAQNMYWEDQGAYTGEISPPMLVEAGCRYVVIGHSERRQFFGETNETVNKKINAALYHGLLPILCVGDIGTGLTATPEQAQEVHAFIREKLSENYGNTACSCAIILYGGSVKPANAFSLLKEKDINGALVGGAALKADSFIELVKESIRAYREK